MSNDSTKKMIIVALGVCLVCSILVSTAAVSLRGIQKENKELDKLKNILEAGDLLEPEADVRNIFNNKVEITMIDLQTGTVVPASELDAELDPKTFDIKSIASSSEYGMRIPKDEDVADINRMPKIMAIYQVRIDGNIEKYILPIYGKGLWSTMYGFLALGSDLQTIKGITFYDHGETPGLGGEVDNPKWKAIWKGKKAFDENGDVAITVIKGTVDPDDPNAEHKVDGLSGSTLTTRGLDAMVKFWLGENGYGPFIQKLREDV